MSSEIQVLKNRLRDRIAEFEELCLKSSAGIENRELKRKLEDLGQANQREKKELEDKLSRVGWRSLEIVFFPRALNFRHFRAIFKLSRNFLYHFYLPFP